MTRPIFDGVGEGSHLVEVLLRLDASRRLKADQRVIAHHLVSPIPVVCSI